MERKRGSETLPSKPTSYQSREPTGASKPFYNAGPPYTVAATIPTSTSSFFLLPSTCPSHPKPILSSPKSTDWIWHEPLPTDAYAIPIFSYGYALPTAKPSKLFPRSTPTTSNSSEPLWVYEPNPECYNKQKQPLQLKPYSASMKINPKLGTTSRRLAQRRKKCYAKKMQQSKAYNPQKINSHLQCVKCCCLQSFGFCANPCLTLQKTSILPYQLLTLQMTTSNLGF